MIYFEKCPIEENLYVPERCGVNMSEKLTRMLGELATQAELWTVWVTLDEDGDLPGLRMQGTPDNMRIYTSVLDSNSDAISVLDPRDGKWFVSLREYSADVFTSIQTLAQPWATNVYGLTPTEEIYKYYIGRISQIPDEIPDDFFKE